MATALSLSPLFRQSVGFDRFNDLFDALAEQEPRNNFPPYDIVKTGENNYQIVMAIAGYREQDLTISVEKDTLKVAATQAAQDDESRQYIHRGIARRNFERSFRLADHMQVEKADLANGVLTIELYREVPEAQQRRTITVNQSVN